MSKIITFFIAICVSPILYANLLLKQGETEVSFEDIDGYAYTIPVSERYGFFRSLDRINSTVRTILNMNHIANYAKANLNLDYKNIRFIANNKTEVKIRSIFGEEYNIENDNKVDLINDYYLKAEIYSAVQNYMENKIDTTDLLEIVEEQYLYNKDMFKVERNYDLQFMTLDYNNQNYESQKQNAHEVLSTLKSKQLTFKDYFYNNPSEIELDLIKNLNNFQYDKNNTEFSDIVFEVTEIGLIDKLFEINNKFIIFNIQKIRPESFTKFEDIKDGLLSNYKQKKLSKDFNELLLSITQDPVEINETAILLLQERYNPTN